MMGLTLFAEKLTPDVRHSESEIGVFSVFFRDEHGANVFSLSGLSRPQIEALYRSSLESLAVYRLAALQADEPAITPRCPTCGFAHVVTDGCRECAGRLVS